MSAVKDKALIIIEHCISRADSDWSDGADLWRDRARERIVFAWQLGMIDETAKDEYLNRVEVCRNAV